MFRETNAAHPGLDKHRFLEESLQAQTALYRFQEDHILHDLLLPALLARLCALELAAQLALHRLAHRAIGPGHAFDAALLEDHDAPPMPPVSITVSPRLLIRPGAWPG